MEMAALEFLYGKLPTHTACTLASLQILKPKHRKPVPVIASGDACWPYITNEVKQAVLACGYALATFDRTEIAADAPHGEQPNANLASGTLAAWAWGYQRCIDSLSMMDGLDVSKIVVTGHSRGGKAALLAGATDQRIWLTHANNAGTLGSASHHVQGAGSETLEALVAQFPHWVGTELKAYLASGKPASELPFDQDDLLARIAPRALLITQALGDDWANPSGTKYILTKCRQPNIHAVYRQGAHPQTLADWQALLDLMTRLLN
jgi:dienelactone hydrolase